VAADQSLADFAKSLDRHSIEAEVRDAEKQRARLAQLFPKEIIASLPLEKYVVGLGEKDTLCYEYEFGTRGMGSIKGGSARKHLIYFSKTQNAMRSTLKEEPDPQAAWLKLRAGIVESLDLAAQGRWDEIDAVPIARYVPALRLKILHVSFPGEVLPIFSFTHLRHFLEQLGVAWKPKRDEYAVAANRRLLQELRTILPGWSTQEIGILLYRWRRPTKAESIEEFAARFDRDALAENLTQAEKERAAFIAEFPFADFSSMPMERYVTPGAAPEGMIYWLERKTDGLGDVSTRRRSDGGLDYLRDTGLFQKTLARAEDAQPLWEKLRGALTESLYAAVAGRWEKIEAIIPPNGVPAAKRAKLLHIYFPQEFLPIYNANAITRYLRALGLEDRENEGAWNPVRNRLILSHLKGLPELEDWTPLELAELLAAWAPPTARTFKIAPGRDAEFWDDCLQDGVITVGWGGVGDLKAISSRDELKKLMVSLEYQKPTEKAGELWRFRNIEVGDWVVANKGKSHILAVGQVIEPGYEYLEEPYGGDFNHILHVAWDTSRACDIPTQERWGFVTVAELTPEQRRLIFDDQVLPKPDLISLIEPMPTLALNRILYGPPGTGKTYSVIRRAASIVDGLQHDEAFAKRRYDELCSQGRIRLATFHQSFGYEDFIEGIRPEMDSSSGAAHFTVRDGVFKEIATDALFACLERLPRADGDNGFEPHWNALTTRISETGELDIPGLREATWILSKTSQGNLQAVNKETRKEMLCGRSALATVWGRLHPQPKLASMDVSRALGRGAHFGVIAAVYNYMQNLQPLPESASQATLLLAEDVGLVADKPAIVQSYLQLGDASGWRLRSDRIFPAFVLVIDEINRGNISRIFGELITLIEDDKRHSADNALTVTLPVSREPFTVPPNLWLLGTMNTADKSLALLDVALRRRFDFEELPPDFSKCASLPDEMKTVLTRLNERLELRKDRDHRIGHAFFTRVSDAAGFNNVFRNKVVPLLQEFFFNDADGARYVLGEHDRTDSNGFLRPLQGTDPRWQRNRWRWFTDEEPTMDCWARLHLTLTSPASGT
jgi:hypothetical protein